MSPEKAAILESLIKLNGEAIAISERFERLIVGRDVPTNLGIGAAITEAVAKLAGQVALFGENDDVG